MAKKTKELEFLIPGPDELNEPPENILEYSLVIFGEKGIGKTSLAAQFPDAVVGMLEPRRRNLRIRMVSLDEGWPQTEAFVHACIADDSVKTIVIDTIDRAYAQCLASICFAKGIKDPSQMNDYGATWREIKDEFEGLFNKVLYANKGLIFLSHAHYREMELRTGNTKEILVPTCPPAAFNYLKAVTDYAFYYGYHGTQRAMYLRGHEDLWTGCGTREHFCDPDGNPVRTISMGETPEDAYANFIASFNNELYDIDYVEKEEPKKVKIPKK